MAGNVLLRVFAALRQRRGQAFVEYVLLLSFVALALAVVYTLFAGSLADTLAAIARRIVGS